jgi:hypothetical protein
LEIGEDGDGFLLFDGRSTEESDALGVVGMGTVREIQPRNVHAGVQQTLDDARRTASGSDGANDFRVTKGHDVLSLRD